MSVPALLHCLASLLPAGTYFVVRGRYGVRSATNAYYVGTCFVDHHQNVDSLQAGPVKASLEPATPLY